MAFITWQDLMMPKGPLTADHFPGQTDDDHNAMVNAWVIEADARIAAAQARPVAFVVLDDTQTRAAERAFALYRAWEAIDERMAVTPLSATQDKEGSVTFSVAQLTGAGARAAAYYAEFLRLVPDAPAASATRVPLPRLSGQGFTAFTW